MKFKDWKFQIMAMLIGLCMGIISCSSSTDPYNSFKGKEINYPQKVDTVMGYSGINHVTLSILKPSDPQVKEVGIFWRNNTDSLKAQFIPDKDTLKIEIDSLESGSYTFNVYTYNKEGVKSARSRNNTVNVYGEDFANSLRSREVTYSLFYNNKLYVYWGDYGEESLIGQGTELYYTSTSGVQKTVSSSPDNKLSVVEDYDTTANNATIQYKTVYINSPAVSDTFKTAKTPNNVDVVNPAGDLVATIVQNDNNSKWDIPDYSLEPGKDIYVDRDIKFVDAGVYSSYEGLEYIRTANDSKVWSDTNIDTDPLALIILRNDIQGPITFYVGLQDVFDSLPWLENENFHKTPNEVSRDAGGVHYVIWEKTFQPGDIVHIGGIDANKNMCLLFLKRGE